MMLGGLCLVLLFVFVVVVRGLPFVSFESLWSRDFLCKGTSCGSRSNLVCVVTFRIPRYFINVFCSHFVAVNESSSALISNLCC